MKQDPFLISLGFGSGKLIQMWIWNSCAAPQCYGTRFSWVIGSGFGSRKSEKGTLKNKHENIFRKAGPELDVYFWRTVGFSWSFEIMIGGLVRNCVAFLLMNNTFGSVCCWKTLPLQGWQTVVGTLLYKALNLCNRSSFPLTPLDKAKSLHQRHFSIIYL